MRPSMDMTSNIGLAILDNNGQVLFTCWVLCSPVVLEVEGILS